MFVISLIMNIIFFGNSRKSWSNWMDRISSWGMLSLVIGHAFLWVVWEGNFWGSVGHLIIITNSAGFAFIMGCIMPISMWDGTRHPLLK